MLFRSPRRQIRRHRHHRGHHPRQPRGQHPEVKISLLAPYISISSLVLRDGLIGFCVQRAWYDGSGWGGAGDVVRHRGADRQTRIRADASSDVCSPRPSSYSLIGFCTSFQRFDFCVADIILTMTWYYREYNDVLTNALLSLYLTR